MFKNLCVKIVSSGNGPPIGFVHGNSGFVCNGGKTCHFSHQRLLVFSNNAQTLAALLPSGRLVFND
jgi:hypothetical protein